MISFEELSQRFPIRDVRLYGACVVVPGADFDPDWEVYLGDKGCICHFIDLDQRPVVLVQRKNAPDGKEIVVYELKEKVGGEESLEKVETKATKQKPKGWLKGPVWSSENEERLLKRMQELTGPIEARARQLAPEFSRSASSLVQKHKKLLRAQKGKQVKKGSVPQEKVTLKGSSTVQEKAVSDYLPFETLWTAVSGLGTDLQERTAVFYAAAVKAGWPVELVESIVSVCVELDGLRDYYDSKWGDQEGFDVALKKEVDSTKKNLVNHKHAVSGEAMLPMEASK